MKRFYLNGIVVLLISFIFSCKPMVYLPNAVNTPLHEGKGDIELGAHASVNGGDFQGSVAVTENISVMGNYNHSKRSPGDTTSGGEKSGEKHDFGEIGVGYYDSLGSSGVYSFYGGYGYGTITSFQDINTFDRSEGNMSRFFVQPAIGKTGDIFETSLSLRTSYVVFHKLNWIDDGQSQEVAGRRSGLFIEPALMFRLGFKYVKLQMQLGASMGVGNNFNQDRLLEGEGRAFNHQPILFSFGLVSDLHKFFE